MPPTFLGLSGLDGASTCRSAVAALVAVMSAGVCATGGFVNEATQARRDALRQQLLVHELRSEQASAWHARARIAERDQAGDVVGRAEAQAAFARHARNIAALERELASSAPGASAQRLASLSPASSRPASEATKRWDLYRMTADDERAIAAPSHRAWNVYERQSPARVTPRLTKESER